MPWFVVRLLIFFLLLLFFFCNLALLVCRCPGSGRKTKVTPEVLAIVDNKMREDDETTACQLHVLLNSKGYSLSLRTILRSRSLLGWTLWYAISILYTIIIACVFNSAFIDLVNYLHIIFIVEAHTAN